MVITTEEVDVDEAVEVADAQGSTVADLGSVEPLGDTEIIVIEDDTASTFARVSGNKKIKAIRIKEKSYNVGNGLSVRLGGTLSNLSVDYRINTSGAQKEVYVAVNGDAAINCTGNFDAGQSGLPTSIDLLSIPIGGVGSITVSAELSVTGSVTLSYSTNFTTGIQYTSDGGFRVVKSFVKKSFTVASQAQLKAGLKAMVNVDKIPLISGYVYAEIGGKTKVSTRTFNDGKTPNTCVHVSSWMYAVASAHVSVAIIDVSYGNTVEVYDEKTSPVRVAYHHEDGKHVGICTRNPYDYYYTKYGSMYGDSLSGYGLDGEVLIPLYEYTVEDGNATITKYNGNAYAVTIPSELDGYTVVGIGNEVFKEKSLAYVVIPDTVTSIGKKAFYGCNNLQGVTIPDAVESIGTECFAECNSFASASLPSNKKYTFIAEKMFMNTPSLSDVTMSDYITEIKNKAFYNSGLISVELNDDITYIGQQAFYGCSKLRELKLPKYLETYGSGTFGDCDALTQVEIPKYVKENDYYPDYHSAVDNSLSWGMFYGCDGLREVTFAAGTQSIAHNLFNGCTGLTEITIPDTVTSIGYHAFNRCTSLETINFSDSVTEIKTMAFRGCTSLKKIDLPDAMTNIECCAFISCSALEELHLPNSLKVLGTWAFRNCTSLKSITIPKGTSDVPMYYDGFTTTATESPFIGCTNLKEVTLEEGMEKIPAKLFKNCTYMEKITMPNSVTTIADYAFDGATNLTEIVFSNTLYEIGTGVFRNCTSLEKVEIPDAVKSMGTYIFEGCSLLNSVKLPNKRINILEGTFKNCTSLKQIDFPDTVQYIRAYAFQGCEKLESITVPDGFQGIEKEAFLDCKRLASVELKGSYIGSRAFASCGELVDVKMSNSISSIGSGAFYDCSSLKNICLSTGLKEIAANTFESCSYLDEVVIPYGVTQIGDAAFKNCTSLKKITIPKATESISDTAFSYPEKMTISGVADSYAETYATDNSITFVPQEIAVEKITLYTDNVKVIKNGSVQMQLSVEPLDFTDDVTWTSSDETIATVDKTGLVTGKAIGKATITVTVGSQSQTCEVSVVETLDPKVELKADSTLQLTNEGLLTGVLQSANTVAEVSAQFATSNLVFKDIDGNVLKESDLLGTGSTISIMEGETVKSSCEVVLVGDVKADGKVNNRDVAMLAQSLVGKADLSAAQLSAADTKADGSVNNRDVAMLAQSLVGKSTISSQGE